MAGWGKIAQAKRGSRERLQDIRSNGVTLFQDFKRNYGPEVTEFWVGAGDAFVRNGVPFPDTTDEQLLFSLLCDVTFNLYQQKPWGLVDGVMIFDYTFPPIDEVKDLLIDHKEEIRNMGVVVPSYIALATGKLDFILKD